MIRLLLSAGMLVSLSAVTLAANGLPTRMSHTRRPALAEIKAQERRPVLPDPSLLKDDSDEVRKSPASQASRQLERDSAKHED